MGVHKRGRIYWYDFEFCGERYQRSTRVTNRVAAKRIEEAVRTRLALKSVDAPEPGPEPIQLPLFADYVPKFRAWSRAHHRPATIKLHESNLVVLGRRFGAQRLDAITNTAIEDFKLARLRERRRGHRWKTPQRQTVSHVSANRALTTLKLLFKLAAREFKQLENPAAPVSRFHEDGCMRVISRDEGRRYLQAIVSPNLLDAAELILETGMRPQEVLGLRVRDVDLAGLAVLAAHRERYTETAVPGKTENAPRVIPLTARACGILRRRIGLPGLAAAGAFLFPARSGAGHVKSVRKQHDRAVARAGIHPAFRLYDLRHTFATRAAEAGVELPVLAAILGHSDVRMTMRYVHPQAAAKRAAILKFEAASSL